MPPRPRFPAYDTSTHRRARPWNRRAPAERGRVRRRRRRTSPEFDRILDLASDDRADIWLGDADDPLRDAVPLLVEHLLLLGVELADRRKRLHVPVFEESAFLKEPVDEGHVALHRAQHDPDDGSRLLRRALPRLHVGEALLAQNLPVGARTALSRRGVVQLVDHCVKFHAGLVEGGEVLREADVRRRAGGVENHGSHVPVRGGRLRLVLGVRMRRVRLLEEDLVDPDKEILAEALAEFGKNPVLDRACPLKGLETEEVLIGCVSRDLLDELAIAGVRPLLDDERSQRHAGGRGGTPALGLEERTVLGLDGGPVDHVGENDILVLRIELHPAGLVESVEGQLPLFGGLVHASCSTMCGDIGRPHRF